MKFKVGTLKKLMETLWKTIDKIEKPVEHLPPGDKKMPSPEGPKVVYLEEPPSESSGYNALEKELDEAFMTPDSGTRALGRSLFTGAAMEPANSYDRNFCPDPPAPEERVGWYGTDSSDALVSPQEFIPKEEKVQRKGKLRRKL